MVASNPSRQSVIPNSSISFSTLCNIIKSTPARPTTNPNNPKKFILALKNTHEKKATDSGSMLAIITETLASIFVKAKNIRPRYRPF